MPPNLVDLLRSRREGRTESKQRVTEHVSELVCALGGLGDHLSAVPTSLIGRSSHIYVGRGQ